MKVLITDKINESAKDIIGDAAICDFLPTMSEDELVQKIGEYDALMVRSQTKVTKKIIEAGKSLKIIGRAGVGVDNIDLEAATKCGIIVVNSPDGNTHAAAEHTVAMMLSLSRNIPQAYETIKQGLWERSKFTGVEVFGKTLGVIGFGKIGQHVAKVAQALGMNIVVYDPYTTKELVENLCAFYCSTLDEFWGQCDYISIHTPKTKETISLINKNTINRMKKGVKIINCARGGIIDEAALCEAIKEGQVSGAAIDVFENEPDIKSSPLFGCVDKCVLTPHLGASTSEAQINVAVDVAKQIREVLLGGEAKSAVNLPQMKPEKLEPVKDYMGLAQNISQMASQIASGNIQSVEITVMGELAQVDATPIEIAVLKGVFDYRVGSVNYVNAPLIAKERGIKVTTIKSNQNVPSCGVITVKIITSENETIVRGAMLAKDIYRITKINNFSTSIMPDSNMLLIPHENKPSMVAKVAQIIGEKGININSMQVNNDTKSQNNESIMILNIPCEVKDDVIQKLNQIDGVNSSKYIKLSV